MQLYGVLWAATGIDQDIPESYQRPMEDLSDDARFHNLQHPLDTTDLDFDVPEAGIALAEEILVLIVNDPMFISQGAHSDVRYNF